MEIGKNWITSNGFDTLPLIKLVVPGTHNSGTYNLDINSKSTDPSFPKFLNKTVRNWAKTQSLDIYQQLCKGARYLDFRIKKVGDELKLIHGLTAIRLETAFEDILRFNIEQPNEPIIIDCNHIYYDSVGEGVSENSICFDIETIAVSYFKNRLVRANTSFDAISRVPLNTVAGKIWLFTTRGNIYFNSSQLKSWWANTYDGEELENYVKNTEYDETRFNISQFILTIQPKTVVMSYINPFNKDTLEYYVNHELTEHIQNMLISLKHKPINVILVDFIENVPEILNWCITSNTLKNDAVNRALVQ